MNGLTFEDYEQIELTLPFEKKPPSNQVNIGLVLLNTEYSIELEWSKLLRNDALTYSSRVYFNGELTPNHLKPISNEISGASSLIAKGIALDVIVFACTSASIVIGEEQVAESLQKPHGNIPATNPWTAVLNALNHLGAEKISVFAPYVKKVNYLLYQGLVSNGYTPLSIGGLGLAHDNEVITISKNSMKTGIEKLILKDSPDVIFMSCTNLRALDYIQEFEDLFGIPIITSNTALFWHAMKLAGQAVSRDGFGKLLSGC